MRFTLLAAGVLLAAALTACSSPAPAAPATTSKAPAPYPDAGKLAAAIKAGAQRAGSAKVGLEDPARSVTGHLKVTGAGTDLALTETDFDDDDTGHTSAGQTDIRSLGTTIYFTDPDTRQKLGLSTAWLSVETGSATSPVQDIVDFYQRRVRLCTPSVMADEIATGQLGTFDEETLNAIPVRQYHLALDPAKAPDAFAALTLNSVADLKAKAAGRKIVVQAQVWVDRDGRLLKYSIDAAPLTSLFDAKATNAKYTMTFQEWGKPVDVAAPAADQVTDLSKVEKH